MSGSDGASAPILETAWSRRFRVNQAKLGTGDPGRVAEVVRELSELEAGRGLSAAERRMLDRARGLLG